MSVYSEWLLVSDIDGTLNDKSFRLPENNKLAIADFVDKGGNFTLCSGRNLESLKKHYDKLNIKTPAIFSNGAGIFDFTTNKLLMLDNIPPEGEKVLLDIYKKNPTLQLTVFGIDTIYPVKYTCIYGQLISKIDGLTYKVCKRVADLPAGEWTKVSFFGLPPLLKRLQKMLKLSYSKMFDCFLTSPFTLEVVKQGVNKGTAVTKLTEILNINPHKVGAIGDYYNDVKMLKAVKHPVCCGQAPDDIKALCEHVTCHCNDGAVCEFINYIEKNYIL